jgi:hypothetical protein
VPTTRSANLSLRGSSVLALLVIAAASAFAQAPLPLEREAMDAFAAKDFERCASMWKQLAKQHPAHYGYPVQAGKCLDAAGHHAEAGRFVKIGLDRGWRNCKGLPIHTPAFDTRCQANSDKWFSTINPEVYLAFQADQAERSGPIEDLEAAKRRDAARLNVARIAVASHTLKTADDYYHAAMVFQHGSTPDAYETAMKLSQKAVELRSDFRAASWLHAAATDRYLQTTGKPQIYGTQLRQVDGKWTMEPFDRTAVSDKERQRAGVDLAEQEKRVAAMNAKQ